MTESEQLNDLLSKITENLPVNLPRNKNRPMLVILENFNTKNRRYAVLKAVNGGDHDWEFVDDGSELSMQWNVVSWIYLPELPVPMGFA